jgi:hypothetical protein
LNGTLTKKKTYLTHLDIAQIVKPLTTIATPINNNLTDGIPSDVVQEGNVMEGIRIDKLCERKLLGLIRRSEEVAVMLMKRS